LLNLAAPNRCIIYSVLVSATGVYTGSSEGRDMGSVLCNAAPVALLDAWGKGSHAIAMMQSNGVVSVLSWQQLAPTQVKYELRPFMPDIGAYIFAGSYLALSPAGTLLCVAHIAVTQHAYVVAIVGGFNSAPRVPGGAVSTPTTAPSYPPAPGPSNSGVTDVGRPVDNVVAGLFGGVSLVAALLALFVASFPDHAAAKFITASARAAWRGGEAAANGLADRVLRGGKPPTQLHVAGAVSVAVASGGERASLLRPAAAAAT
jgi:hypothetical protein